MEDIKTLQYMLCPLGELHEGEQLNFVCVETTCKDFGLICPVCRTQKHQKHRVLPLKIFLQEVAANIGGRQIGNSVENLVQMVDGVHQKMLFNLKDIVLKMAQQIKLLEESINSSHKNTRQQLFLDQNHFLNIPMILQTIINNQHKNIESLKQDIKKIIDNTSSLGKLELSYKPQKVYESYNKLANEFQNVMNQLLQSFKSQIGKINKPFEKIFIQANVQPQYFFSQMMKSPDIAVTDKTAIQNQNQNYDNRFALIEPQIIENSKILLKVSNIQNFVGLGVCLRNVLASKNYKFDYNNVGHGSYLISSNGYSWSHLKKEDNIQAKSFKFVKDDIIQIELNYEAKVFKYIQKQKKKNVTFTNKKKDEKHVLALEIPPDDEIYFCVNLCSQKDQVEILQDDG